MTRTVMTCAAVLVGLGACMSGITACGSVSCEKDLDCPQADAGDGGSPPGEGGSHVDASSDGTTAFDGPHETATGEGGTGCQAPMIECDGSCVDPTQPGHCGTCNNVCTGPDAGAGQATCTSGVCGLGCTGATSLNCSGACVDPSQIDHCGSCGHVCPEATTGTGTAICTATADGGDQCSVTCSGSTTETCVAMDGTTSCFAPTDPNHCGSCDNACPAPTNGLAACSGATPACGFTCNSTFHACASACLPDSDDPSVTTDPCVLTESFGIFVKPTGSDVAACGTRAAPCATVGYAMDAAKTAGLARVYACGSAGNYTENLVVGASRTGVTVYGGLDCTTTPATWTYNNAADKATIAPASGYALEVTAAVTFEDFGFVSANATAAGASSIAVFASNATGVVLERCNVTAGTGMPAVNQAQPGPYTSSAPSGNPGGGPKSVPPGTGAGGPAMPNPACGTSVGGAGGSAASGEPAANEDGQAGQPAANNAGTAAECNLIPSQGGGSGAGGTEGPAGAAASSWAAFSSTGWTPTPGQSGSAGTLGEGGGGGGAGGALNVIGGGGGGGAGGCGGGGGPPGAGGGSSIALLAYNSSVELETCTLVAANAGSGGNGAAGQAGQPGGGGGTGNTGSCNGGGGGTGGPGGPGGGGAGGLSAGVVWTGTAPTITAGSQTPGTAGAAGTNGDGTTTAKAGTAGGVVQFQ